MSQAKAPGEESVILECLSAIRWRLFSVRLAERLTTGLLWGGIIALPLTGARLLRHFRVFHEDGPWLAGLLAVLPLLAAWWLYRRSNRLPGTTIPPRLAQIGAGVTAALALGMLALVISNATASIPVWAVAAACVGMFTALAAATVRMINARAAAIFVDQQVGLSERVSTALEILQTPKRPTPLEAAFNAPVIASAIKACEQVKTARVGYNRLDRRAYALAAVAATAAVCISLLPPVALQAKPMRAPVIAVQTNVKDMKEVLKELEEKKLPNDKVTQERIKPLETAIQKLEQGNMSQIEANAVLNEAKEQIKRDQEALAASDKVQQMLREMSQTQDLANAADQMKDAQMKQAANDANAANQQKAAESAMKNAADALADKLKNGTDAEKKEIADKLQAAANGAKSDPQLQQNLQNAADAARNGNAEQMSKSMQAAGQQMGQQMGNQQMSQGSVDRAMAEIDRMQNSGQRSTMGSPQGSQGTGSQQASSGQSGSQDQNGNQGQNGNQDQNGNQPGQSGAQPGGGSQMANGAGQGNGQNPNAGGSTNFHQPGGGPGPSNDHGGIGGTGSFVRIYDQRAHESQGSQEKVGSFINPLGKASGSMEVMGQADKSDPNIKTYQDVLPEARQRAMDEITRQTYPPQYEEMVRQFYSESSKK